MFSFKPFFVVVVLFSAFVSGALGQPVSTIGTVVTHGPNPELWDIRSDGSLVNKRDISWNGLSNFGFIGLTENSSGGYVSNTHHYSGTTHPQHRFGISDEGGASLSTGPHGVSFDEGGVALHPSTGDLWAVTAGGDIYSFPGNVPTYEMSLSVTSLGVSASSCAGMTFSASGDLYVLALGAGGMIFEIDVDAVALTGLTTISASVVPGDGGMDFSLTNSNELYVVAPVFNGISISQRLLEVNRVTGATQDLGETTDGTITGLVIQRPILGYPGSTTHVDLAGISYPAGGGIINVGDVLRLRGGQTGGISIDPQGNPFIGSPVYLFIQRMPNGGVPMGNPIYPEIHLDFFSPIPPEAIINGIPLPQAGLGFSFNTPPGLSNLNFMLQAVMLNPQTPLGFATTRAIEVRFM